MVIASIHHLRTPHQRPFGRRKSSIHFNYGPFRASSPARKPKILPEYLERWQELDRLLGTDFKDLRFLQEAMTHPAFANEHPEFSLRSHERLAFLGSPVIEMALNMYFYHRIPDSAYQNFPTSIAGALTKIRERIANARNYAKLAEEFHFPEFLLMGKSMTIDTSESSMKTLATAYRAVIAALHLDQGYIKAHEIVLKHFQAIIETHFREGHLIAYKTALNDHSMQNLGARPRYPLLTEWGPDHAKFFEVAATIKGKTYGKGQANSIHDAEEMAAKEACATLEIVLPTIYEILNRPE